MMSTITIITVVLALSVCISTDSLLIEKCGCIFKSKLSVDCSNRENIDFQCLSESKPEEILMKNNNLTDIPTEMFKYEFNATSHIDFSENAIEHVPESSKDHFVGLQSVNFSFNHLTDLSEVLSAIDAKVKLSISGNHFKCDCNDPNIIQYYIHAKEQGATPTCYSPVYKRYIPLTAKCHAQFNPEQPKEGALKTNIIIFALGATFAVFVFCVLTSQNNE